MKSKTLFIISETIKKYASDLGNAQSEWEAERSFAAILYIVRVLLQKGFKGFNFDEDRGIIDAREDADTHLPYGLCKEYGIELSPDAEPSDAWNALKEKTGRDASSFYAEKTSQEKQAKAVKVRGPKQTKEYVKKRFQENPRLAEAAKKFTSVLNKVKNFDIDHPNAEDGTYDALTGKNVSDEITGYCVTFHQNLTADDPFGGYDDDDYAAMCAIAQHDLGSKSVYIGHYGNPEVSFTCDNPETAFKFAVEHNQMSVYDSDTGNTIMNKFYYDGEANPIKWED